MGGNQPRDGDISRGCRQNDSNAWRHLIRAYTGLVYRIAMRMLRNQQDAEDASQEVFMRVHRSIHSHDPTRPLAPWLSRITYNVCLKRISQKNKVETKTLALREGDFPGKENENTPERQLTRKQTTNQILNALDRLSAQDRALVAMRYSEGFTDSEIADSTDMPVGTVKTRLHRARGKLRKILAPIIREASV
jgi:RNA polymerase sigma-70 factor (ECF subfamily)